MVKICDWVRRTRKLTSLDLSNNPKILGKISGGVGSGLDSLTQGLAVNNTLTEIDLSFTCLGNREAQMVLKALRNKWNYKKIVFNEETLDLGLGNIVIEPISSEVLELVSLYISQNNAYKKVFTIDS